MLRLAQLACVVATAAGKGAGVWTDPNHYKGHGFAGVRIVAEDPPHVLKMVGTDDGKKWWSLSGTCSGEGMTTITFDFTPKGGPPDLKGTWAKDDKGVTTITWPDGNAWTMLDAPTEAWKKADANDAHAGLFTDPNHYISASSYAGTRYIAEDPPHELKLVGTDDGASWFFLEGKCTGVFMTKITLDFSPKGGPKQLTGDWKAGGMNGPGTITWPDGNAWSKVDAKTVSDWVPKEAPKKKVENAATMGIPPIALPLLFALMLVVVVAKTVNRRQKNDQAMADLTAFEEAQAKGHGVAGQTASL